MNPRIEEKVKKSMLAGYDAKGNYTPPMEVRDIRMMKETPMAKPKPKVSKAAEKERVKQERIARVGKQLLKEQMQSNPEVRAKAAEIKKKNPKASEKELGMSAVAQVKRERNLKFIEDQKRFSEERNKKRLQMIKGFQNE